MLQNAFASAVDTPIWVDAVSIDDSFSESYGNKWYKITAAGRDNHYNGEPADYYFTVTSNCLTTTMLYNPDGTEIARRYNSPSASGNMLTYTLESGGTYYLRIRSSEEYIAPFTLIADYKHLPYPGTAKESAILLTYGRNYDDAISSAGESRWYKYTANRAELHNNGAENAYTVAAYGIPGMIAQVTDSNGNPVTILQQDVFGSEFGYTFEMNLGDTYYFRVIAPNNYTGEYYIWISSNNTYYNTGSSMSDAIVLPFNSWVQGSIDTAKQSKWYKFTVTEHCDKVTVQSKSDIRVEGILYDMNGARIASDNDYPDPDDFITPTDFVICETLTVGYSYYICVTGKTNETGSFKLLASDKIPVEEVVVSPATKEIAVGSTYKLTALVYPSNATDKSLKWYSGNDAVATVNSSGVVTAKGTGSANIYAASKDGSNKLDYCVVTVKPNAAAVTISPSNLTMNVGETKTLTAIVSPSNVYDSSVTWSSSDSNIATVDKNGKVTAKSVGTATIKAITTNGKVGTCAVEVTKEKVIVSRYEKIGDDANGELRVQFTGSGKVWRVVNKDTIYYIDDTELDPLNPPAGGIDPEKLPPSEMDLERCYSNLYVGYDPSSQNNSGLALRVYTDDEIKLLYALDPYGVADYVQRYSLEKATGNTSDERVSNAMRIKDHYFEVIFGKAPLHYTRTSDGIWLVESNPTNLADCYSDSESIFGMHMVWDEYLLNKIDTALKEIIIGAVLPNLLTPLASYLLKLSAEEAGFLKKAISFVFTWITDSFSDAVSETVVKELFNNTIPEWAEVLANGVYEFVFNVNSSHTLYPQLFDYYIEELNYQIYIESDEGLYKLEDIRALMS